MLRRIPTHIKKRSKELKGSKENKAKTITPLADIIVEGDGDDSQNIHKLIECFKDKKCITEANEIVTKAYKQWKTTTKDNINKPKLKELLDIPLVKKFIDKVLQGNNLINLIDGHDKMKENEEACLEMAEKIVTRDILKNPYKKKTSKDKDTD